MSSGLTGSTARLTVTAFFDSRTDAEEAVSRLHAAGVSRDSVRIVPGAERDGSSTGQTQTQTLGGASEGFWDSLRDLFLPDEDRNTYAEGLRRGGYLVSVSATEAEYERVLDILDDEGTIDIDERANTWRSEGWSGTSGADALSGSTANLTSGSSSTSSAKGGATSMGSSGLGSGGERARSGADEVIPIAEEHLNVGKRDVNHGRVRVRSYVVETPVNEQVNLREERVEVERRPVDRAANTAEDAFRERTVEMEERREEAVVSKEARVKEELVVKKGVEQRTETISDTVRKTEVDIEDDRTTRNTTGTGNRK